MTDLCFKGGVPAMKELEYKIDWNRSEEEKYNYECKEFYPQRIALLKKIITECPNNYDDEVEIRYFDEKEEMIGKCSKDSVTGESCSEVRRTMNFEIPYSQWKPYQCESSCVAEYEAVLREKAKTSQCYQKGIYDTPLDCYVFKISSNPLDSCGNPNYVEPKNSSSDATKNSSSDATTLTSHVVLFSLIICLLFALFK